MKGAALLLLPAAAALFAQVQAPPINFENSPRIYELIRGGELRLSLSDAIGLALENNLDVEIERYVPRLAAADLLRAKGGGVVRGLPLSVAELPPGVGGPASPLLNTPASGNLPGSTVPTGITELSAITPGQSGINLAPSTAFSAGPPVPSFDPALTGALFWQHQDTPQTNTFVAGTPSLVGNNLNGSLGIARGFSSGATLGSSFLASRQNTNSTRTLFNPYTSSSLGLTFTQPLLHGFGGVNRRYIRIAQNGRRSSDLLFRQQAIATVAGIIRIYDDLVSLDEDVKVKQQTLALAERLYQDNRIRVDQGTLAPIELTRAQAQVAAARQDLANSQGFAEQQELILKTVITRRGTADPAIRGVRLVPADPIEVPANEPVRPAEDLVAEAYRKRPELEGARLQINNSDLSLEGSHNQTLPQLDLVVNAQNAALAGQLNPLAAGTPLIAAPGNSIGGLGTGLDQIFRGRYPSYSAGLQLTLPLKNRVAEADLARDQIQLRQNQARYQQLQNQIRLEVEGALIAVSRSRSAYDAAVEARTLQEKSLNIEMEKYDNGLSTTFLVMQYQGYLAQARSTEVAARGVYAKARTALERALGATLEQHNVSIENVLRGR